MEMPLAGKSMTQETVRLARNYGFLSILHSHRAAWAVLAVSLCITLVSLTLSVHSLQVRARDRFEFEVQKASFAIAQRMQGYEQVLRGGVGLFKASEKVTRDDWHDYVENLQIDTYWPGIQGIGHTIMLSPAELDRHIAAVRKDGFPGYSVYPAGERAQLSSIIFLEPFTGRNLRAFGYDMFSEKIRREAMELARDNDSPAVSGRVTLVQEMGGNVQHGFLMYLPLYRKKMPITTVEQRRAAHYGYVYSPFRIEDLMRGILGPGVPFIDFVLYDGPTLDKENVLYMENKKPRDTPARFSTTTEIKLPGRVWGARFESSQQLEAELSKATPIWIGLGGLVLNGLLFYMTLSLSRSRIQATKDAAQLSMMLEQQQLAASVFSNAREGILITNPQGIIIDANNMFSVITGYSKEEAIGQRPHLMSSGQHDTAFFTEMFRQIKANGYWTGEIINRCKDGSLITTNVNISAVRDVNQVVKNFLMLFTDITEQKRMQDEIQRQALHDGLTGLANRRLFMERLEVMRTQSLRSGRSLCVAFLDLDGFKPINDHLGHDEGDEALLEVARRLRKCTRAGDTAARLGGDEFGLLLSQELGEDGAIALERVRQLIDMPYFLAGKEFKMSASIGYTVFPEDDVKVTDLIRHADKAMYRAKQDGGNKVCLYS